ncbi:MAG: SIS domain-containing protein [Candidatus Uhrbacteria bacterium]|nr:SIS domain-containing protein [Candidatus Uhrbacteria bacterium]
MMRDAIVEFAKQFYYAPEVERPSRKKYQHIIVAGMGGSHLSADVLKGYDPTLPVSVYHEYGIPYIASEKRKHTLLIASSYSGNTEETIDAFQEAGRQGIDRAALSVGGTLMKLARKEKVSYVQMPDTGIQPRCALGFSIKALVALMGLDSVANDLSRLAKTLKPLASEQKGKALARQLKGMIPLVYASSANESLAYNWKIKFNETGKIPAFYNVLPELNHNEMTGFDVQPSTEKLSKRFVVLFLRDTQDHPRIMRRMDIIKRLYAQRGLLCENIALNGTTRFQRMFSSLLLADWTAYYTATQYGLESEQVPMVEEFKKMIVR